ncbi:hypothetical protein [Microvirga guangxiensis]|nr:hypothetical protein [Microvirga guangxiensis]
MGTPRLEDGRKPYPETRHVGLLDALIRITTAIYGVLKVAVTRWG